jgi:predicted AAA+ superfamily ATPase
VTGPRQAGKTTLCRSVFPHLPYVNLEDPQVRGIALTDPVRFLQQFTNGAILDEIQRAPLLASYLQVAVDKDPRPGRFILTGSQQFEIATTLSQSLAGRAGILRLLPFSFEELAEPADIDYWLYSGSYPRIHDRRLNPTQALGDYLELYVERDLRSLLGIQDLDAFRRFLKLAAGRVGQLLNVTSLASDVGVSRPTVNTWLSVLRESFIAFSLQPYHANLGKRLTRSPKLYFYDVGLAAYLMDITHVSQIASHPLRGSLVENLVVNEVTKYFLNRGQRPNLYFYRDSQGLEVDLLVQLGGTRYPLEVKSAMTFDASALALMAKLPAPVASADTPRTLVYAGEPRILGPDVAIPPFHIAQRLTQLGAAHP